MPYDLKPAASELAGLLPAINDADLGNPTPCAEYTVATLLSHIAGLAWAFHLAAPTTPKDDAARALLASPPAPRAEDLPDDWRTIIPDRLKVLAETWDHPAAWEGEGTIGGVTMPATIIGLVALDELVLHGWDVARATGQNFRCDERSAEGVLTFTQMSAAPGEEAAREGLFGPVVPVPADAPVLERALGLSGRDPQWTPPR